MPPLFALATVICSAAAVLIALAALLRDKSRDNATAIQAIARQVLQDDREIHSKQLQEHIAASVASAVSAAISQRSNDDRSRLKEELETAIRAVVLEARLAIVRDVSSTLGEYARREVVETELKNINHRLSRALDQIEDLYRISGPRTRVATEGR